MKLIPIKTKKFLPPQDDLLLELKKKLHGRLRDGDILVITSKVVSIHEGRSVPISDSKTKKELVRAESDAYLKAEHPGEWDLSVKHSALLLSAGIDESNAAGHYLLLPKDPMRSARMLRAFLIDYFEFSQLGIVISDSHSLPFRYGTLGISLGFAGFKPVRHFKGKKDLFGRAFEYTRINVADAIAGAAVFMMGETTEQTPLCIVRDVPHVLFSEQVKKGDLLIPPQKDIYYPLLRKFYE